MSCSNIAIDFFCSLGGESGVMVNSANELAAKDTGLSALAVSENLIAAGTESTKEGVGDVSVLIW